MGNISLTRYLAAPGLGAFPPVEEIHLALKGRSFRPIDDQPEIISQAGWVEAFDWNATVFDQASFHFGATQTFDLRIDSRKVPGQILNRYFRLAVEKYRRDNPGKRLNSFSRAEIKETVRAELLAKAAVETLLVPVYLFRDTGEVWLFSQAAKAREAFEVLWLDSFPAIPLKKLTPFTLAEKLNQEVGALDIKDQLQLGERFLRFLWDKEAQDGLIDGVSGQAYELIFLDRLTLKKSSAQIVFSGMSGDKADGCADEIKVAFKEGKNMAQARLQLSTEDKTFVFTLAADTLTPAGLKLPQMLEDDDGWHIERFDRVAMIKELLAALDDLYAAFLKGSLA